MEESTNQSNHTTNRVRVKSSNTNLKGETRINYYILGRQGKNNLTIAQPDSVCYKIHVKFAIDTGVG